MRRLPHQNFLPGFFAAALLCGFVIEIGCSSVSRTPATGGAPPPEAEPEEQPPSDAVAETSAPEASPNPQGLTDDEILAMPPEAAAGDDLLDIDAMSLADLNARNPLADVYFNYDSAELSDETRRALQRNAEWLRRYPRVRILVEGHCDERGTVEYNLALGEERARSVRDYLGELDVGPERIRIISYGKEFPVDPGHTESAWRQNRRAHLEITAK